MKIELLRISLALLLLGAPDARTQSDEEKALVQLEQDWSDAVVKHDTAVLGRVLAEEYTYTDPAGRVTHKQDDIVGAMAGDIKVDSYQHSDMKVRVYGDTAVVTGQTSLKGTDRDAEISGDYRWTDMFVRRGGTWQVVASQATFIQSGGGD